MNDDGWERERERESARTWRAGWIVRGVGGGVAEG